MRWENLSIEADDHARLPGYRDPAVVRRFAAPEALETNFYEVRAKSILNRVPAASRMPFRWTINPYRGCSHGCAYCFARPTHKYLDFNAGRDFEREIVVKVNAPEVLRAELARPSWKHEHVALGTNTDPYQWVEGRYRLMVGIWEALRDAANPCSVLTKSPLLLRDLELMLEIAERTSITACLSIPTLDEKAWRASEPQSSMNQSLPRRTSSAWSRETVMSSRNTAESGRRPMVIRSPSTAKLSPVRPPPARMTRAAVCEVTSPMSTAMKSPVSPTR